MHNAVYIIYYRYGDAHFIYCSNDDFSQKNSRSIAIDADWHDDAWASLQPNIDRQYQTCAAFIIIGLMLYMNSL